MKSRSPVLDPPFMLQSGELRPQHGGLVVHDVLLVKFVCQVSVIIEVLRSNKQNNINVVF